MIRVIFMKDHSKMRIEGGPKLKYLYELIYLVQKAQYISVLGRISISTSKYFFEKATNTLVC